MKHSVGLTAAPELRGMFTTAQTRLVPRPTIRRTRDSLEGTLNQLIRQRCKKRFNAVARYLWASLFVAVLLMAGASTSRAQVSFGINIGPPPQPRSYRVVPRSPGQGYIWIDGYWYPSGRRYKWHGGYYTRTPYAGARWVGPRYESHQYYAGYWEGDRGRVEHDHHWDRERNRDRDRYHDQGRNQDQGQNYDQRQNRDQLQNRDQHQNQDQDQDQRHDDNR